MKQGRIQEQGTFQHLVQNGLDFSAFLASEKEESTEGNCWLQLLESIGKLKFTIRISYYDIERLVLASASYTPMKAF